MSLLNIKTIMLLVLAAVASWNFPWGVVADVGIIAVYVLVKRNRPRIYVSRRKDSHEKMFYLLRECAR